jgi:hypothetical protein
LTDDEVMRELRSESSLNKARRLFSNWSGRIEQVQAQRRPISPIEMRRMEFQAVREIAEALGAVVTQ